MKSFLLAFSIFIFIFSSLASAKEEKTSGTMAYLIDGLDEIKHKDVRLAFALWTKELAQVYNVDAETVYYESHSKIIKDYEDEVFLAITLSPIFYLQYQDRIELISRDYYIAQRTENRFERMFLLVRKDSKLKDLKDLEDRTVATKSDSHQSRFFLNKELLEELHIESKGYIKEMRKTSRFTTAVLNVFFKKTDACIVPEYIFKLVSEMNPAVGSALTPIARSQNIFMPSITIFNKNTPLNLGEIYEESVTHLGSTPRGENILTLFKMKRIIKIDVNELQGLKTYYTEYINLKKKYL